MVQLVFNKLLISLFFWPAQETQSFIFLKIQKSYLFPRLPPSRLLSSNRIEMSMSFSYGAHDDRWGSDLGSAGESTRSFPSFPANFSPASGEELIEVTIENPSGALVNIDSVTGTDVSGTDPEITSCSASDSGSREWSASSSRRIREDQVVANAKQFSRYLRRKLRSISLRDGGYSSRSAPETVVPHGGEITYPASLVRSLTQRFTRPHRNGSCTQRAIHGLRFISSKENGIAGWREVQNKFANLSKDGHLCRSDFAHCIGSTWFHVLSIEFSELMKILNFGWHLVVLCWKGWKKKIRKSLQRSCSTHCAGEED